MGAVVVQFAVEIDEPLFGHRLQFGFLDDANGYGPVGIEALRHVAPQAWLRQAF